VKKENAELEMTTKQKEMISKVLIMKERKSD
jgi:hypothetical protein